MTVRHLKLFALLLPLFVVRSMLPIGFMLSFDGGTAQIIFCASQSSPSGSNASHEMHGAAHQGHEHHHGSDHSDTSKHSHHTCPFAFAAAAPLTAAATVAIEPPSSVAIVRHADATIRAVAHHAHLIRGPPALS